MATDPLPHDAVGWASLAGYGAIVLGAIGGVFSAIWTYLRGRVARAITGVRDDMLERDQTVNRRISDLAAGHVRELEAFRLQLANHQDDDKKNFAELHGRLDGIREDMARRDDLGRVENKIDQLLLRRRGSGPNG